MDRILFNGNILTQDAGQKATAVAIRDGLVAAVGDDLSISALATENTQRLDLQARTLIPGFEDPHAHVWKIGHLLTTMVDLRQARSLADLADLLKKRCGRTDKGSWLHARGFNEAHLAEGRRPTRQDLDRWVPDRPLILARTCGHVFVANSIALQLAGIDRSTPAPQGGVIEHDQSGQPNGILHETAAGLVQRVAPPPSAKEYETMILAALRHQLSHGITSSSDCGVPPPLLDVYLDMDRRGVMPARMVVMPLGLADGSTHSMSLPALYRSPRLCINTVKFLADGGLSGATAALSEPYRHSTTTGVLRFADDALRILFRQAQDAGWRIATHAIGDVAIEQVIGLYEELGPQPEGRAHRIEHFGLPSESHLRRAASLGLMVATQSIFLRELGRNFLHSVPPALLHQVYPFQSMLKAGLTLALSSDAPVVEDDRPLAGMHAAMTRKTLDGAVLSPEQAITATQSLLGYTREGAKVAGEAATRGTIQTGRVADLAVLSADPTAVPADALLAISVEMTIVGGNVVYTKEPSGA